GDVGSPSAMTSARPQPAARNAALPRLQCSHEPRAWHLAALRDCPVAAADDCIKLLLDSLLLDLRLAHVLPHTARPLSISDSPKRYASLHRRPHRHCRRALFLGGYQSSSAVDSRGL